MFAQDTIKDLIEIPNTPPVQGLVFRHFRGESDFVGMVAALNASEKADGVERVVTVESITGNYKHLTNCDLSKDLLIVEVADQIVGYMRVDWYQEENGPRFYNNTAFLRPEWRRRRIGTAMLKWAQRRLGEIAATHPTGPKLFSSFVSDTAVGAEKMLQADGYQAVRWALTMVRPTLENITDFPLPADLEVRPVTPDHYRAIWTAAEEAFRDHWGYSPSTEDDYQVWLNNPIVFTPEMWKIAWDIEKNEVAGQVRGFIDVAENEGYQRQRGYCEFISTRRPWRKRGVARALIALTLQEFKSRGLTESALGVDAENLSGALRVYQESGFKEVKRSTIYRKPIE